MFEAFPVHHSKEAAHDVSVEERANWQRAARARITHQRLQKAVAATILVLLQALHKVRLTGSTGRTLIIFIRVFRATFRVNLRF